MNASPSVRLSRSARLRLARLAVGGTAALATLSAVLQTVASCSHLGTPQSAATQRANKVAATDRTNVRADLGRSWDAPAAQPGAGAAASTR